LETLPRPLRAFPIDLLPLGKLKKRSRENLNAQSMDKFDLENLYYDHAYEKTGGGV